jgi:predicted nicotinamide N-methyase
MFLFASPDFICSKNFIDCLVAYLSGLSEVAAQAATDKSLLNTQVDDLTAKKTALNTKAKGLAVEAAQLRTD